MKIVGNRRAINMLNYTKSASCHILKGPKGLGKASVGKALARHYLCQTKKKGCNCISCKKFDSGNHPDFLYVGLTDKSIKVEEVMHLVNALSSKPLESEYKVLFIDDADSMTIDAQNKLLKSIEEAPSYIKFIIISHGVLLKTIESRCLIEHFYPLTTEEMATCVGRLTDSIDEREILMATSSLAPGIATKLYSNKDFINVFSKTIDAILNQEGELVLQEVWGILKEKDKSNIIDLLGNDLPYFFLGLHKFFYDAFCVKAGIRLTGLTFESKTEKLYKLQYELKNISSILSHIEECQQKTNKLTVDMLYNLTAVISSINERGK